MNEKKLLAELTKNCKENRETLNELLNTYELAEIGIKVSEAREKEIYDSVLAENEFYSEQEASRIGVKKGDRILDNDNAFLLSNDDFERLLSLAHPIFVAENICDENGYYITNWLEIKVEAMNTLVDFIIEKILPSDMREDFAKVRRNVVYEKKLIDITRKSFVA